MGDLSEHFSRHEFACKDGCGYDTVDTELLEYLETIRNHFDKPVTINSCCRCIRHNTAIGGAATSQHLYGRACDIVVEGVDALLVQELAAQMGVKGLGHYTNFTHIDSRSGPLARW